MAAEVSNFLLQRLDPAEQMQHIGHLRQAIQYAAQDTQEGKIPGFCILGKVSWFKYLIAF